MNIRFLLQIAGIIYFVFVLDSLVIMNVVLWISSFWFLSQRQVKL